MSDQATEAPIAENTGIDRIPSEQGITVLRNMRDYTVGLGPEMNRKMLHVVGGAGAFFAAENREELSYRALWAHGVRYLMDPHTTANLNDALATLDVFKNILCSAASEDRLADEMKLHTEHFTAALKQGLTDANRSDRIRELLADVPEIATQGAVRFISTKTGGRGMAIENPSSGRSTRGHPDRQAPAIGDDS